MEVELLVVPDCPNEGPAGELLRSALHRLAVDAIVTTTVIESDEDAQLRDFAGSPTFLINGRDPFAAPGAAVGLSCRVYPTATGLAGAPTLEELCAALRQATAS